MQTLSDLLVRLSRSGVDFVIVGEFAGVLHGSSYVTRDLDLCAGLTPGNMERLRMTLADLNPRHRLTPKKSSFLEMPVPGESALNLNLETDWGVIDLLSSVPGLGDFERVKANAETFEIRGETCRMISLEDLIRAKESLNREKDLLAVKELQVIAARRRNKGVAGQTTPG